MEKFETGHVIEVRICPNCKKGYCTQHGGQKSGVSPAIHIPKVGEQPVGYCSTRCLFETQGKSMDEIKDYYKAMGLDYDEIFPSGYLAPSRRLEKDSGEVIG